MESGPSVRRVFAGVGISDCSAALLSVVVVVVVVCCGVVVCCVVVEGVGVVTVTVVTVTVAVLGLGREELLHPEASRPSANTVAAKAWLLRVMGLYGTHQVHGCYGQR